MATTRSNGCLNLGSKYCKFNTTLYFFYNEYCLLYHHFYISINITLSVFPTSSTNFLTYICVLNILGFLMILWKVMSAWHFVFQSFSLEVSFKRERRAGSSLKYLVKILGKLCSRATQIEPLIVSDRILLIIGWSRVRISILAIIFD